MNFLVIIADSNTEVETEQLRASVDFLVELCDTVSPVRLLDLLCFCACLPYYWYTKWLYFNVPFIYSVVDCTFQVGEANFANWAHQAVDFILGTGCRSAMHFIKLYQFGKNQLFSLLH
jgi:hypothetical protein